MTSEVSICNLALAHLGEAATISSIEPPEGSAQAEYCALFYPIARDSLLELHNWSFATKQIKPAQLSGQWSGWRYEYTQPADSVKIVSLTLQDEASGERLIPYTREADSYGSEMILTNDENISLKYIYSVLNTNKFPPLFTMTLSWHLASMLAGPILKGEAGSAEAKRCTAVMQGFLAQAAVSDTNQSRVDVRHPVSWMQARS